MERKLSLDFYLEADTPTLADNGPRIFIRRNGQNIGISREEWDRLNPGVEPVTFSGSDDSREIYSTNITNNLGRMAAEAGIYEALWHPNENGIRVASEMINFLEDGLAKLRAKPGHFRQFNSPNGWGLYDHFVPFVEGVLNACRENPNAKVRTWI